TRQVRWTDNFEEILASDVDVIVELVGGVRPAGDWVRRALHAGKSVVTANKHLIATEGDELLELARKTGQRLEYGASVAGGVPVLCGLEQGLAGEHLFRLTGVLNGTCNYILSKMEYAAVQPTLVPLGSPLAQTRDNQNVLITAGVHGGETVFAGCGAGGGPTSVAIVSDLVSISRGPSFTGSHNPPELKSYPLNLDLE